MRRLKSFWSEEHEPGAIILGLLIGLFWLTNVPRWVSTPFRRFFRWTNYQCIVCGRAAGPLVEDDDCHMRYCSCDCASYDGALRNPKKSWVLFGNLMPPKPHHEHHEED